MEDLQTKRLLFGVETARLRFEKVTDEHRTDWLRFCAFPGSLDYIGLHEFETPEAKNAAWFDRVNHRYHNNLGGMNALIEKASGKLVGQCGLLIQEIDGITELEIGYSLMPEFRGQGFALEAAQMCKQHAFSHNLAPSLISVIHLDNDASAQVARRNGMFLDKTTISKGDPVNIYRILNDGNN